MVAAERAPVVTAYSAGEPVKRAPVGTPPGEPVTGEPVATPYPPGEPVKRAP